MNAVQLQRLLLERKRELDRLTKAAANPLKATTVEVQTAIAAHLTRAQGPVTTATRERVMTDVRRIIDAAGTASKEAMKANAPTVIKAGAIRTTDISRLIIPRGGRLEKIVDTYQGFERMIEERKIFVLGSTKVAAFEEKYLMEWGRGWASSMRSLQSTFSRSAVSGLDWRVISKTLVSDAGKLIGPDIADPERFSNLLARMMVAELDNLTAHAMGDEAGLELYVNLGVPDEGQTEECYEACNAGAMTLEEWEMGLGLAPRHEGCRCEEFPVPSDPGLKVVNDKYEMAGA